MPNENDVRFLYGGTFNPPHLGHLIPLQSAADILKINNIELMPAHIPPLKSGVQSSKHRVEMLKKLIKNDKRFSINTCELETDETSYTYKTLKRLKQQSPKTKLVFIIGQDSLKTLNRWRTWRDLFKYANLLVLKRQTNDEPLTNSLASNLPVFYTEPRMLYDIIDSEMDEESKLFLSSKLAPVNAVKQGEHSHAFMDIICSSAEGNLWLLNNSGFACSSTTIRNELSKNNWDITHLLPSEVLNYIKQHNLYSQ